MKLIVLMNFEFVLGPERNEGGSVFPLLSCSSLLGRMKAKGIDAIPAVVVEKELATTGGGGEVVVEAFSSG